MAKNYYYIITPIDLSHPVWGSDAHFAADLFGGFCEDNYATKNDVKDALSRFAKRLQAVRDYTQEKNPMEYNKEQVECIPGDDKLVEFMCSILDIYKVKAGSNI